MIIQYLGKKRKGEKDFHLVSESPGFTIQCFKKGEAVYLHNITEIKWMNHGSNVMVEPGLNEPFNFRRFEKIIIRDAEKIEGIEKETFYTT